MEIIKFDTLGLDPKILRAITEMGFEEPSPIQAKAIPEVMAGHDAVSYTHLTLPTSGMV